MKNIVDEAIVKCLDHMYRASQPSITWEELNNIKDDPDIIHHYYLSQEDYKYISNMYAEYYRLKDTFKEHCDILINDIIEGCYKDKYISSNGDSPGYRDYEKVLPLKETLGEEIVNKVIEFIKERKDFYKFDRDYHSYLFTVMNYSPTSNKQTVIDYWKSKGIDLEIIDRDPVYNYERYNLGCSEEEINEIIEEEKHVE